MHISEWQCIIAERVNNISERQTVLFRSGTPYFGVARYISEWQ